MSKAKLEGGYILELEAQLLERWRGRRKNWLGGISTAVGSGDCERVKECTYAVVHLAACADDLRAVVKTALMAMRDEEVESLSEQVAERNKRIAAATALIDEADADELSLAVYCALNGHSRTESFENGMTCTYCGEHFDEVDCG